jgi:hypothetical protein
MCSSGEKMKINKACLKSIEFWVVIVVLLIAILGLLFFFKASATGMPIQEISLYTCVDTDGGINPFVEGAVSSATLRGNDKCLTSDGKEVEACRGRFCLLQEFYCRNNGGTSVLRNCPERYKPICYKGRCVEPTEISSATARELVDYSS